ncbi:MAG: ABC transporter ATP-binding protein [Beijerinckiaceae bacterium]|nr:ABC transporter ATP-binding protein [Beijerinckiaceae bacterium]
MSNSIPEPAPAGPVLSIEGLSLFVRADDGQRLKIVENASFSIAPGQFFALVGESGSGKTMIARAVMRLVPDAVLEIDGAIRFGAHDLAHASERVLRPLRGCEITMIFQEPMSSLNPLMTVERQLMEAVDAHGRFKGVERRDRILELLRRVRFRDPELILKAFPHELSGGMRQRVMIAAALINEPKLLIADEPTTALDVTIQREVLDIIAELARDMGLAVLFISHDLSLVYENADEIAVLYGGVMMEQGPARKVIESPAHPYTAALLACVPHRRSKGSRQVGIEGAVPSVADWREGCRFVDRCGQARAACRVGAMPLFVKEDHSVRCLAPLNDMGERH